MEKIKLVKREYVGESNFYEFVNDKTGEKIYQEISKEQYNSLNGVDGYLNNPIPPKGHTFTLALGGAIKVDTGFYLRKGEYTIINGRYYVIWEENGENVQTFSEEEFNNKFTWQ